MTYDTPGCSFAASAVKEGISCKKKPQGNKITLDFNLFFYMLINMLAADHDTAFIVRLSGYYV